ncbi:MAG: hypothetical protein ACI4NJ_05110 [Cellvibrio sp.]
MAANPSKRAPKYAEIKPDWLSKSLAGLCIGFFLAVALSGLFAWWGPGGISADNKSQFNMWIVPPIWLTVFSFVYFFRDGMRAWLWLGGLTLVAFTALFLTRYGMGAW